MSVLKPWPEDQPPLWVDKDLLCQKVSGKRFVFGEGNPDAPLCFILDNPGERERKDGTPYVCGTRETLRLALKKSEIPENLLYVTFLFKCRPTGKYDRAEAVKAHLPVLKRQLTEKPRLCLMAFGDTVVRALFGKDESVKKLRGQHLLFQNTPLRVSYHPLACRRRPNLFPLLLKDLASVKDILLQP